MIELINPTNLTSPGPIGGTTPSSGFFATLVSSSVLTSTNVSIGSTSVAPDALLTIMGNTAATVATDAGTIVHLVGADATSPIIETDAFGSFFQILPRRANGTLASKTGIVSGDALFNLAPRGWDTTAYVAAGGFIQWATETWSTSAHGSRMTIRTVANTTIINTDRFAFWGSGGMSIGTSVVGTDPGTDNAIIGGIAQVVGATATAAGGAKAITVGSSGPSIYWGSGVPSLAGQNQGSLYLRTDGSSTTSRMYVATSTASSSAAWASLTASS